MSAYITPGIISDAPPVNAALDFGIPNCLVPLLEGMTHSVARKETLSKQIFLGQVPGVLPAGGPRTWSLKRPLSEFISGC